MDSFIIKIMADWALIPVVLLGAYALVFKINSKDRLKIYSQILIAGLLAYLLAKFAANIYQSSDQRPFEVLGVSAGASYLNNPGFPSDHTLFVTAILCAVWFTTKQKAISITLLALLIIISVGRVLALVHTPVDVIGGMIFGLLGALWYLNDRAISHSKAK
jgi:membrane-associated phospholipid phosphatase